MWRRVLQGRRTVLAVALIAAVASAWLLVTPGIHRDYTLEAFVASGDESYAVLRRFMGEFVSNEFALIAVESDDALSESTADLLSELTARLRQIETVQSVTAVTDIPKQMRWLLGESIRSHPLIERNLLSTDGRTAAILMQMSGEGVEGDVRRRVVAELRRIAEETRAAHPNVRVILAGPYVTLIDMYDYVDRDLVYFSIAAFALLAVMLGAIFRRPGPAVYAVGCGVAATCGALALGIVGGLSMSLVVQMIVILVTVLTVANGVHLAVAAEEDATQWTVSQFDAIHRTLDRMWKPCAAVTLTTMVGFASVMISQITPVRVFGFLMLSGLLIGLIYTLATAPMLPPPGTGFVVTRRRRRLADALAGAAAASLRRPVLVTLVFAAATAAAAYGIPRLTFESDFVRNFRPGSDVRTSYEFIEEHLTPLGSVEVVIKRRNGASIATADDVKRAAEVGRRCVDEFGDVIKKSMTLADVLSLGSREPPGSDLVLKAVLAAVESAMGEGVTRNFINPDRTALRINLRAVEGVSVQRKLEVCSAIEQMAGDVYGDGYDVTVTGLYTFYAGLVANLVRDQFRSFAITVPAVFVVFALLLRSVRTAVIALVPNMLPVAICLGTMAWLDIPVNMTTMMMLSVVFGIAVDDTIHYLWRCREEFAAWGSYRDAIRAAHRSVGRACLFTSVVIAGGFWILMLSRFLPTAYFGGLVGYTMLAALATDLLLLPVLIVWCKPFGKERTPASASGVAGATQASTARSIASRNDEQ